MSQIIKGNIDIFYLIIFCECGSKLDQIEGLSLQNDNSELRNKF